MDCSKQGSVSFYQNSAGSWCWTVRGALDWVANSGQSDTYEEACRVALSALQADRAKSQEYSDKIDARRDTLMSK